MPIIEVENLSYTYASETSNQRQALKQITFSIEKGTFVGIIGGNGSGKSTLVQHLNGLLRASQGRISVCGMDVSSDRRTNEGWKKVGLVFQ